jgi:lysophospholipase L1-like esterase
MMLVGSSCLAAGSIAPAAHAGAASSTVVRVATCLEPTSGGPVEWTARYESVARPDHVPALRMLGAGEQSKNGVLAPTPGTGSPRGAGTRTRRVTTQTLPTETFDASAVRLLSPDDNCSLDLTTGSASDHRVDLIGDSVFARIQKGVETAGSTLRTSAARNWAITATSGFGWSASGPTWPLATTGTWAIGLARGFFTSHPTAVVVELGADDALRAVFADVTGTPLVAAAIRDAVSSNVEELIDESRSAGVPCTVLVTAPAHSTTVYGAGIRYSSEARQIDQVIKTKAAAASDRVVVADWETLSSSHHGGAQNWFLVDNVHPNVRGEMALIGLIQRSLQSCPT